MAEHIKIPFSHRLGPKGIPVQSFPIQYSMVPDISAVVNEAFYHGKLRDAPAAAAQNNDIAQQFRSKVCTLIRHGPESPEVATEHQSNVITIDFQGPGARTEVISSISKYNTAKIKWCNEHIVNLIGSLTEETTWAILTMCDAQKTRLHDARLDMIVNGGSADELYRVFMGTVLGTIISLILRITSRFPAQAMDAVVRVSSSPVSGSSGLG